MMEKRPGIVILGGGLTGLSAAYHLKQPWTMFEKEERLGGLCRTEERMGYLFDYTGHWLHLRDEGMKTLVGQLLPRDQIDSIERKARVYSKRVTTKFPFQANLYGLPSDVLIECLMDAIEAPMHRSARTFDGSPGMKTFESYIQYHFGKGIAKHFMIPYNEKLWGIHPRELTYEWCSYFIPRPDLREIVVGAVTDSSLQLGHNNDFLYPKRGGIESLIQALESRLRDVHQSRCNSNPALDEAGLPGTNRIYTHADPDEIDFVKKELVFGKERYGYKTLVSSIPLTRLLDLMNLPREIDLQRRKLRCTSLTFMNMGTRNRSPSDWHWLYVPESRYPFHRIINYSNASPGMAPVGRSSLCVEMSQRQNPWNTNDIALALTEMKAINSPDDIVYLSANNHIDHAYVIFDECHKQATKEIHEFLRSHDIISTGRYGKWTYSLMEHAMLDGKNTAIEIDERMPS